MRNDDDDDTPVHVKSMFVGGDKESPYMFACHLAFKDATLTIDRVKGGEITGSGGKKTGKPVIYWREKDARPFALNKTNVATIIALYGTANVKEWRGKRLTLFPTTTTFGKDTVECIRIRPVIPEAPRGEFDLDGVLAEIAAADTDAKLTECRAWLNETVKPPPRFKPQIKAALDDRAKKNAAELPEPGSDSGE